VTFEIEVGELEKHRLQYEFSQLLGRLTITVDKKVCKRSVRLINEPVLEVHSFEIGEIERSLVRIEKERKQLFGHKNRLYVNNRLVRVFEGM
jgi:hypothetical protein